MDIMSTLAGLWADSGFAGFFAAGGWKNLIMIAVACVLLYLGIAKKFEPLLLVGIAFGCLLTNIPGAGLYTPELWDAFLDESSQHYHSYGHILANGGFLDILLPEDKDGAGVPLSDAAGSFMLAGRHALPIGFELALDDK